MFENIAARLSKTAAESFKEETLKSFEPIMKAAMHVAPLLGALMSTCSRSRKAKASTIIINYFGGIR